jgi:hypothetical protein
MSVRREGKSCASYVRTCVAWTFRWSLLSTALTITRGDVTFIWATKFVGGQDAVEEFLACTVYPLAAGVGFDRAAFGVTPVSKVKMPLPKFVAAHRDNEDDVQFLARIELYIKGIMGSYTSLEHDACIMNLHNGGRLNRMFELAGMAYGPRPVPGFDAFIEASKKRKVDAVGKAPTKRMSVQEEKGGICKSCCTMRKD